MEEYENININDAVTYLDEGYVLSCVNDKRRMYFLKKGEMIISQSGEMKFQVSIKEFINLFKESKFNLVKDDQDVVDELKDKEYYSWGKKM